MANNATATDAVVSEIRELLNQEKWTRAAINNYTVRNLKELDAILDRVGEAEVEDEVLELCDEHLQHTKNSIIALYLSGIINLSRQTVDDSNLVMLVNIFTDNRKWNIVQYIAERMLDFGENKFALRTLADCYNNENKIDEMYEVWERLIKIDYEEADIVKHLAEKREEEGEIEEAVAYYKKALHRYVNKKAFTNVKETWHKLIKHAPDETEFFYYAEGKIARQISEDRAVQLLEDLYPHFREEAKWEQAVDLLKRILAYDPKNPWARKEIVDCYREMYQDHSHLDEYIRLSNLNQGWRNVHDAIADFEKHIAFDAGNFVFHRSWGVGLIRNIEDDVIRIDFVKKRGHEMSLKMAVSALSILPRDHIWVLKTTQKKEKLHDKVKGDPEWALKIVIRSLDNAADLKKIKSELVPSILTPGEWSSWSSKAREILKTDESFGNLPDRLDHFVVRDQPITLDEKIFNKFKAEKTFFDRVKSIGEFLHYADGDEEIGTDSDFFREMFDYFVGFLRSSTGVNEYVVSSFLLAERIVAEHPYLNPGVNLSFPELFEQIEDVEGVFSRIDNSDLKKEFLVAVRRNIDEWPSIYVRLFPHFLTREIIHDLERHGREEELAQLFHKTHEKYRDMREQFIWLIRNCEDDDWFQNLDVDKEKILINMIHLLDITFREISNRKDVSLNRKLNRQVQNYLLKENRLTDFVLNADEESVSRVYALVDDVEDLDPAVKLELRHKVVDRFPDFRFYGEQGPRETVSRGDFFTTASRYEEKQKELSHIHEVEVPQNSQEIAAAREYGDLRENAEYKAAKERQEMLNNTVARLKEDLERATIVRQRDVDTSRVSFGTIVKLTNLDSNEVEEYTVLGPWESDPNKHILSYLSPLGGELYGSKPGEELSFEINERTYNYRVETIEAAKLS